MQSENASGFASQELTTFIFNMKTRLRTDKNMVSIIWIFTESQTRKTQLDSHYSFLNNKFQAYVEDKNDTLTEDDISKSISFNGGIYGTDAVLVDADDLFFKRTLKIINLKINTDARENHEVCWLEDSVHVTML